MTSSGFHLHHLVWGIVLLPAWGFVDFVGDASSPRTEILAGLFGIGAGLTLDEFALWIHRQHRPSEAIAGAPELSGDDG